ncbi:phosphoadenosine phosphosulfate reductase [Croceicoccus estronivorus]|uniref:phosphoadenylyl-sulfate reductase n=1 Tax=Croceicoccus estronivorus TaxID=1172626 RepID=UPI00082A56E5|nr:phosphoadenylyl-sulfate reductase [Croceicoccus estronivorus]OCC25185.1 phosphoadenosine phosphosulfate reductase [Croceicoccus estronivorus]
MAEAARRIDRIDTSARFTAADAAALNARYAGASAEDVLRAVLLDGVAGRIALVSSFGAESSVLLHMASRIDPAATVLFLETGKHFPETLDYRNELAELLGLTNVQDLTPDPADIAAKDESGLRWSWDPDGCCDIRKVLPLANALASYDASITGRKAFQSATRADLPLFELDTSDSAGRLKVNPLISWDKAALDAYMTEHDLPRHPLVEQGYPSIGCSPCTSKVAPGEDPRSGRWKGWDKTECGIHAPSSTSDVPDGGGELPPGYEPVF